MFSYKIYTFGYFKCVFLTTSQETPRQIVLRILSKGLRVMVANVLLKGNPLLGRYHEKCLSKREV